jgi:hypothetical protein
MRLSTADAKPTSRLMQRRRMVQERVWQCARLRASILLRRRRASSDMQRGHIADADETIRDRLHRPAYAAIGHTHHRLNLYHPV